MRNYKMTVATIVFSIFFFATFSHGADVAKIGIVDFQKILDKSNAGKKAANQMKKRWKELLADLKKRGNEIEKKKKKMEQEALVMSKKMRLEKDREIRIDTNDFKSLQKQYNDEMKQTEAKFTQDIQHQVLGIIKEIGKKEGFLIILEKREAGVLYAPDAIDITDRLIQLLNAKTSEKTPKKQKK